MMILLVIALAFASLFCIVIGVFAFQDDEALGGVFAILFGIFIGIITVVMGVKYLS